MTILRFGVALVLTVFAVYVVVMNWACVFVTWRNKRHGVEGYHSTVPIVTVPLAVAALLAYPSPPVSWCWLVPLVDIGNWRLLLLPAIVVRGARHRRAKS